MSSAAPPETRNQRTARPLFASIRWTVRKIVALLVVLLLICSYVLFSQLLKQSTQLLYRDSASFASNIYFSHLFRGAAPSAALDKTQEELALYLPRSGLLHVARDGRILRGSGSCELIRDRLDPAELQPFTGPYLVYPPFHHSPVCKDKETLLSGAAMDHAGTVSFLLLTSPVDPFRDYLSSPRGLLFAFGYPVVGALILVLCSAGALAYFRRLLLRHAGLLSERARQFAAGDLTVRFDPGEFPELESIARTFNTLASELTDRIRVLERDDDERRHLMTGLAHDMRTPMTAIEGCIALLRSPTANRERRQSYVDLIGVSVNSERELALSLEQLASLSEIQRAKQLSTVPVGELVHRVGLVARPIAERKSILLVLPDVDPSITIEADEALLRRALLNLLDNALRHAPEGGGVELTIAQTDSETVFAVRNDGPAFSEVERQRVERRLTHGTAIDPESSDGFPRHGLGLTIVYRIAELHGGRVEATSNQESGTTFRLSVPNRAVPLDRHSAVAATMPESRKRAARTRFTELSLIVATSVTAVIELIRVPFPLPVFLASFLLLSLCASRVFGYRSYFYLANLVALVKLLSIETMSSHQLLIGWTIISTVVHLFRILPNPVLRLMLASIPVLCCFSSLLNYPWQFLLGVVAGLWVSCIGWLAEAAPPIRRAGYWLSSLLMISTTAAVFFTGSALYFMILQATNGIVSPIAAEMVPRFLGEAGGESGSARSDFIRREPPAFQLRLEEILIRAYFINPIIDYVLLTPDSTVASLIGVDRSTDSAFQLERRLSSHRDNLLEQPYAYLRMSTTRSVIVKSACIEPGCMALAALFPSRLLNDILHRLMNVPFTVYIIGQLLLASVLFTSAARRWSRAIGERAEALNAGLRRYREGRYDTPIGLVPDDEIGELAQTFDTVAGQIASLEQTIVDSARQRRLLFERAAIEIDAGAESIRESTRSLTDSDSAPFPIELATTAAALRRTIESIFELAALDSPQPAMPAEQYPLSELIEEEVLRVQPHSQALNSTVQFLTPESDPSVYCPVAPVVEVLRGLLELAAERSGAEGPVTVSLHRTEDCAEVVVEDSGPRATPEQLQRALNPLEETSARHSEVNRTERRCPGEGLDRNDARSPLSGFSVAVFARKIASCGGTFSLHSLEERPSSRNSNGKPGIRYRIRLPIASPSFGPDLTEKES